jgi:hypothetical protein
MGGDGGQVIDRATMVRCKGYGLTKSAGNSYANSLGEMANYVQMIVEDRGQGYLERRRTRMQNCKISQQALMDPVVACRLGNLYIKEALIGALLNKRMPPGLDHVRALKDVKNCLTTWAESEAEEGRRRLVCPVSREDLDSGGAKAVVIWKTGAVISAKTLKELKLKDCPITGQPFDPDLDVIPLCPDDDELAKLQERLPAQMPAKKRKEAATSKAAEAVGAPDDKPGKSSSAAGSSAVKKAKTTATDKDADKIKSSTTYKDLFTEAKAGSIWEHRDPFGTPAYNRGSRI